MILLVVDTQKAFFNEDLYSFETVKNNIKKLITVARENNVEVAYVQHDDGPGSDVCSSDLVHHHVEHKRLQHCFLSLQ